MSTAPANYEQRLVDGVRRRLEASQRISEVEAQVEGEFPRTLLLVRLRDSRFPGRVLGNYSSVWNDDGTPMFSWDAESRSEFVAEVLQGQLEALQVESLPAPDDDEITWF